MPIHRADNIGSLLRPPSLLAARSAHQNGQLSDHTFKAEEDRAVDFCVAIQEVVEARGGTLKVRARWSEWRTLDPIARDIFVVFGTQVAFDRDRQGRVTGYRLSAARTLNVRFRRDNPPPG